MFAPNFIILWIIFPCNWVAFHPLHTAYITSHEGQLVTAHSFVHSKVWTVNKGLKDLKQTYFVGDLKKKTIPEEAYKRRKERMTYDICIYKIVFNAL